MRHPLPASGSGCVSESVRAGSIVVGDVDLFVVEDVIGETVSEGVPSPVGLVLLSGRGLGVVEPAGLAAAFEVEEGLLLDGIFDVAAVGDAAGDDDVLLAGSSGDRGGASAVLHGVGGRKLVDVVADLARVPGGEQVPAPGHAQVDLTDRERFPRVRGLHGARTFAAGAAEQEFGRPGRPLVAGLVRSHQLDGDEVGRCRPGPDQVVAGGQVRGGEAVGESVGPAVAVGPGEGLNVRSGSPRCHPCRAPGYGDGPTGQGWRDSRRTRRQSAPRPAVYDDGFTDLPDLGGIGLQVQTPNNQTRDCHQPVIDPELREHSMSCVPKATS